MPVPAAQPKLIQHGLAAHLETRASAKMSGTGSAFPAVSAPSLEQLLKRLLQAPRLL